MRSFQLPGSVLAILLALHSVGTSARQPTVRAFIAPDLHAALRQAPHSPARVILRGEVGALVRAAARHGLTVHRVLDHFVVVSGTAGQASAVSLEPGVVALSSDLPVGVAMTVSDAATAANQTRAGQSGLLGIGGFPGVTGAGVGVAVVDSGIAKHDALKNKIIAAVSFVPGDTSVDDGYGHGTHIAGIIAGAGAPARKVTAAYGGGIAPGANLVNVRVLGREGVGLTSSVIAGLDWVISNRARYGIRVVNLSLGHGVTAPCALDPLCSSVQRLVEAGLIVVASAGNRGKTPDGRPVLGGITSPGNSPFAITAGALNTWNTVARGDDTVTTYSSRGPTAYDFGVKPDVVAPGNKIISLEAQHSYLAQSYPAAHMAGRGSNAYSRMSGTSMAAGMLSGAVALLVEAYPDLTWAAAKYRLQITASFMAAEGLMAAGTGSIDVWAARRSSGGTLLSLLPTSTIGGVVTKPGGAAFRDAGGLQTRLHQGRVFGCSTCSAQR